VPTSMITQLLTVLPAEAQAALMALAAQHDHPEVQWEAAVQEALTGLDWEAVREQIGALLAQLLPLEMLVRCASNAASLRPPIAAESLSMSSESVRRAGTRGCIGSTHTTSRAPANPFSSFAYRLLR
jgi:hypothetical protein